MKALLELRKRILDFTINANLLYVTLNFVDVVIELAFMIDFEQNH